MSFAVWLTGLPACGKSAIAREHQLKRWSHDKKEALIRGDRTALDWLSHRSSKATTAFTWRDLLNRS